VGLSGILLALRGGTTAFYSGMNYTCRILTAASIGGWMNATRRSLPVGALLGSMSLVLMPDAGSPSADHEFVRRVLSERRADPDECGVGGGPKEKTAATQKSYHLIQNLSHCNKIFCVI